MQEPAKTTTKQFVPSLIINGAMCIYAICTFIAALKAGIAWRILLSGTGVILFIAALVLIVNKMLKLRKEQSAGV